MKSGVASSEIQLLLKMLDEAYSVKTWHGPNLKGSLRGLTAETAAWRPGPKRHNIWEAAVHAGYWKYIVRRRLLGEKRGSFALKGSNWFVRPLELSDKAWRDDLVLLDQEHARLREAVASLTPASLSFTPASSKVSNLTLICGIANHDIYHAGQIQLLKRLQRG
jgi:DinB superfamily